MKDLKEFIEAVNKGWPNNKVRNCYLDPQGRRGARKDHALEFIVNELVATFDSTRNDVEQFRAALKALETARQEITYAIDTLMAFERKAVVKEVMACPA